MRKMIIKTSISILTIVTLLLTCTSCAGLFADFLFRNSKNSEFEYIGGNGDYIHHLFDDYEFMRTSSDQGVIVKNSEDAVNSVDITEALFFYKYAFTDGRYIAMHVMKADYNEHSDETGTRIINETRMMVSDERIQLFDAETGQMTRYGSQDEFNAGIKELGICFEKWYYPGAFQSEEGKTVCSSGNVELINVDKQRGQIVRMNGSDVLQGTIRNYSVCDKYVLFDFTQDNDYYDVEFLGETNSRLSFYQEFGKTKYLAVSSIADEIKEFDTENELLDFLKTGGLTGEIGWERLNNADV